MGREGKRLVGEGVWMRAGVGDVHVLVTVVVRTVSLVTDCVTVVETVLVDVASGV